MSLAQLSGMIRYEFKMHWRRRALLVVMLSITLIVLSALVFSGFEPLVDDPAFTQDEIDQALSLTVMLVTWLPMSVILIFILPVALADTIPLDRQHGVDELINSTPLTPATYLTGKLLGVWLATLAGLTAVMVIITVAWWVQVGGFDLRLYLEIWLVNALSITVMNGGLGVLLAVAQPNRRRAVIFVIGLFAVIVFVSSLDFGEFWTLANPVRLTMITYFIPDDSQDMVANITVFQRDIMMAVAAGLVQLAVLWGLAWGWLRYRGRTV